MQCAASPVQVDSGGGFGTAEDLGDLTNAPVLEVVQGDRGPLLAGQRGDGRPQLVVGQDRLGKRVRDRAEAELDPRLDRESPARGDGEVDRDASHPGPRLRIGADRAPTPMGTGHGFLGDVLGDRPVSARRRRKTDQGPVLAVEEGLERLRAGLGTGHAIAFLGHDG